MSTPERRHIPRTKLERLAYINIEPDNGGIVLNVSDQGLCFHSIAPVKHNGRFHFSLLQQNRRIDAAGELTWTDEIEKVGGVRFTTLTADAREQIQDWISQPAAPVEESSSTLGAALLKAFPRLRSPRWDANLHSDDPSTFSAALRRKMRMRVRIKLTGFSAGLATGLLISLLWGAIFLLSAHRRDIGESLIHLGARLAGSPLAGERSPEALFAEKSATEKTAALPAPPSVSPKKEVASPVRPLTPAPATPTLPPTPEPSKIPVRAQIPVDRPKSLPTQSLADPGKPPSVTSITHPSAPAAVARAAETSVPRPSAVGGTAATNQQVSAISPTVLPAAVANVTPSSPGPPAPVETAIAGPARNYFDPASLPQMYFELGKFRNELWARDLSDKLAALGFRASVIQKGHLWLNAYHVVAGPYTDQDQATRIHKDLLSHGYKPRPFERGSRSFIFGSAVTLNGSRLPVGDFTISWESYVTDAKVKFEHENSFVATAEGRWVKRPSRYEHNEIVYLRSGNGSKILLEIHFLGQDRALVFRDSS